MSPSKIEHKLPLEVLEGLALDQKPRIVMSEGTVWTLMFDLRMVYQCVLPNRLFFGSLVVTKITLVF